jgi:hypothetical protein
VFYDVTKENWWCLRFILPGLPALILLGSLGISCLNDRFIRGRINKCAVAVAIGVWAIIQGCYWGKELHVTGPSESEPAFVEVVEQAKLELPKEATVICMFVSGCLYYYTDFSIVRWDMISQNEFRAFAKQSKEHPLYAVLYREEEREAFGEHLPGKWHVVDTTRRARIWRFVGFTD